MTKADVKVGGWGGDGGSGEWEWPFPAGSNLSKIQVISNAECIVSVMFTTYSPQGGQHNSKKHGGAGVKGPGILTHNIQLGFGELVSEIRGTYAVYQTVTVITSLTFVVGTQENGPYGKVNGTAFSLPIIDGHLIQCSATHNVVGIGSFKSKLQRLKSNIKIWRQKVKEKERSASLALRNKIDTLDAKAEISFVTDFEIISRNTYVKSLTDLEHSNIMDLKQKAKIRWELEGDENSRFFHDPLSIKNHIFQYFDKRFKEVNRARPSFASNLFKQLSNDEVRFLDCPFTTLEIKDAVWDCDCDKAPGPDGFAFKFFKNHWDTLENDVIVTTSRYVVPTGRVKVPAGRYVVPTGKDNVIVSAGRSKVIPAEEQYYPVVLCFSPIDSIVSY
ncbi:cytochrome P450 [Tanacetum coccineum]